MPVAKIRIDKKPGEAGWHSEKQRLEALALFLTSGSIAYVSEALKISEKTLWRWKYEPWWKERVREIEQGNNLRISSKVTNILSKGTDALDDRLTNGNFFFNKETRTLERKPLSSREIVEIVKAGVGVNDSVNKSKAILESQDLREKQAQATLTKLQEIANKLNYKRPHKVIDVEVVDEESEKITEETNNKNAIKPELQEGLQAREQVQEYARTDPQTSTS